MLLGVRASGRSLELLSEKARGIEQFDKTAPFIRVYSFLIADDLFTLQSVIQVFEYIAHDTTKSEGKALENTLPYLHSFRHLHLFFKPLKSRNLISFIS